MSMIPILFKDIVDAIVKWWKRVWFESKLKARLKMIEIENQIAAERELEEHFTPEYTEEEIDPELQTGESLKLGGAIKLTARWHNKEKINNTDEPV